MYFLISPKIEIPSYLEFRFRTLLASGFFPFPPDFLTMYAINSITAYRVMCANPNYRVRLTLNCSGIIVKMVGWNAEAPRERRESVDGFQG